MYFVRGGQGRKSTNERNIRLKSVIIVVILLVFRSTWIIMAVLQGQAKELEGSVRIGMEGREAKEVRLEGFEFGSGLGLGLGNEARRERGRGRRRRRIGGTGNDSCFRVW